MNTIELVRVLRGWKAILSGRIPLLSIEITKRCPLSCPGCYAYGEDHLGPGLLLTDVREYEGKELVDGVLELVTRYRPIHLSIVGGEPLVRFRELNEILPRVVAQKIHVQVVTSAVRPIPLEWARIKPMTIAVSIDGLPQQHDVRRKPATYQRILKNIQGHRIRVHCTITRDMTGRRGYLREFVDFWSAREEVEKIWMSIFTPQIGEKSGEIVPPEARKAVIQDLLELCRVYPKLAMGEKMIKALLEPPADPEHCIFARTTRSITADLQTRITPCQFGGNPDCSQCGCIASVGMAAIARHHLPGGIPLSVIYEASVKIGNLAAAVRQAGDISGSERAL